MKFTLRTGRTRRPLAAMLLAAASLAATGPLTAPAAATTTQSYVVLAKGGGSLDGVAARVAARGGTVVARYDAIGVLIARSSRAGFESAVVGGGVQSAAATTGLGTPIGDDVETTVAAPAPAPAPGTVDEPLWANQWDMRAIRVAEAHSITTGTPDVVVGVLDSGIDPTHPDLAGQVDPALSASCLGGVADTSPSGWTMTTSDHGTHVAGTIAAADNGTGIIGVAPGVRLASVKVVNDDGFIYPEAAICGFMWAAEHGFDVTNNSYFIDPWEFHCRNDERQRPVWQAVQRALRYADQAGVVTVASAGNSRHDLQHRFVDDGSPNDGSSPPESRDIGNQCLDLPAEAPGVVTVSATGPTGILSFYSNHGLGVVEVSAPGGDSRVPGSEPNGRVLSAIGGGNWGYKQGTSMAAPHVAGVAALIRSQHPDMSPAAVTALLQRTAEERACPDSGTYTPPGSPEFRCYGSTQNNGFYGHGEVDAHDAVAG